jgi:hypothetical protein
MKCRDGRFTFLPYRLSGSKQGRVKVVRKTIRMVFWEMFTQKLQIYGTSNGVIRILLYTI